MPHHRMLHELLVAVQASVIVASIAFIIWWVSKLPAYLREWRSYNIEIMTVWTFAWREAAKIVARIKKGSNRGSTP
jgi:hypothetical protein